MHGQASRPVLLSQPGRERLQHGQSKPNILTERFLQANGVGAQIVQRRGRNRYVNLPDDRIDSGLGLLTFNLKPLLRRQRFGRDVDLHMAERFRLTRQSKALCELLRAKCRFFGCRNGRQLALDDPHLAAVAPSLAATERGQIDAALPGGIQQRLAGRNLGAPANRLHINSIHERYPSGEPLRSLVDLERALIKNPGARRATRARAWPAIR